MKRSSSAANLPQAMSNKLICLHVEFLFMEKCSTWHVDNVFINAFRLKFRLSNSTSPKTACSSKIPKTKKIWKLFRACADKSLPCCQSSEALGFYFKLARKTKMEQGKTELFSGLQLDEQQCSWSPSKTTKRKNSTEQTELESQVKQS